MDADRPEDDLRLTKGRAAGPTRPARQQTWGWNALVDDLGGHGRGLDRLAARAGVLAADVAVYKELRRHAVELLADLFAHALERLAAGAVGGNGLVVVIDAWQVVGQSLAHGAAWRDGWHCRAGRQCLAGGSGGVFLARVGHDQIEQHGLSAPVQTLAGRAEAPVLQARDLEAQRFDLGLLELQLGVLALDDPVQRGQHIVAGRGIGCAGAGSFEHGSHHASRACAREVGHSPMDFAVRAQVKSP